MNWHKKASLNSNVTLNPTERQIFDFLLQINQKYQLGLTFRVAGGWVRDKILGKESDDIDISLDKMTGEQFGQYIAKEMGWKSGGNLIQTNPDQSKHIATLVTNLFGQKVEINNLRKEVYDDGSRIPKVEFGTPQEDAHRRDFTINSMHYNINTGQIEDHTGLGRKDLQTQVLRTPDDPLKTFQEDPLRIMRAFRFFSRYPGMNLDPQMLEAMKDPQIQQALKNKITRERVWTEWEKLFKGQQQSEALRVMHDTGIWKLLFGESLQSPELGPYEQFTMDQRNQWHVDNVFEHTLKVVREKKKVEHHIKFTVKGEQQGTNA